MSDAVHIQIPADPAAAAVEAVTDPAADIVEQTQGAVESRLDQIIELMRLNNDHLVASHEAHERTIGHLAGLANTLTDTAGHLATAAANVAGEAAQTVLTVPEVAAEPVDAVVEQVADPAPVRRSGKDRLKRRR
jgi:hypothetical protein